MANLPTSIKNLNTLLGEQLTEGGGGGSSDFSMAQVTFNNSNSNHAYMAYVPAVQDAEPLCIKQDFVEVASDNPYIANIPLYKGKIFTSLNAFLDVDYDTAPVLTGAITYDANSNLFLIEGDGTITLRGSSGILPGN